jgi:multidrug efflux system outer membrane protein
VTFTLALAGCALGPDYERPWTPAADAEGYLHAAAEAATLDAAAVDPWWRGFGDPAIAGLVEAALEANTDLKAAAARVLEARAGLRQAGARLEPEVDFSVGANRQKNSFVLPGVGRVSPIATTYSDDLSVAYQADLFGGLRRGRQAAWADLLATEAARDTVAHAVISEVVRARVRLSTLGRGADLARAIRDSWAATQKSIDRRYRSGVASALELRLARENLASAEASVVGLEQQLAQARLALDVLLGRRPGTGEAPAAQLAPLPQLAPVPVGLPAALLERRPDVRAAELRLAAATARIGVAIADLFPTLTLTGGAGRSSDVLDDLLETNALVYRAVAGVAAAIFDGGRRRAAVAAARARADEAAAGYAGAVLQALREVEDALVREAALREQLVFLEERVEEARAADRIARGRFERGVEELLGVLETERRMRAAEEALVDAQASLWNARVDLYLALGGDWTPDDGTGVADSRDSEIEVSTERPREDS